MTIGKFTITRTVTDLRAVEVGRLVGLGAVSLLVGAAVSMDGAFVLSAMGGGIGV